MCCYAYAGLPHNVVKLRLQTQGRGRVYKGVTDALVCIAKEEGIRALGKGVSKNAVAMLQLRKIEREDGMTLQAALEAGFTAIFVSTVTTVPENITCKLQFQREPLGQRGNNSLLVYGGPLDCMSKVLKRGVKGLFRGYSSVLLRDVPATPIVVGVYHAMTPITERMMTRYVGPETPFTPVVTIAFATAASLGVLYPADVVKAHMQTATASSPLTLREGFRLVFVQHGLRGFYRGGAATAISGGMSVAALAAAFGIMSYR